MSFSESPMVFFKIEEFYCHFNPEIFGFESSYEGLTQFQLEVYQTRILPDGHPPRHRHS